ncbi:MAG: hypothetical protein V4737_10860 [Curtobacterium sp.]
MTALAVIAALVAAWFVLTREEASTRVPEAPLPTATLPSSVPPGPSSAPSDTAPLPPDAAGCSTDSTEPACADLQSPEPITSGQAAATATARSAVIAYAQFDAAGEGAWHRRLQRYLEDGVSLEVTALARRDSVLANLQAATRIDQDRPVQAYVDGATEDGQWLFTVNATAIATYVDATGTKSTWTVPGTWTVTIDPSTRQVTDIDEDTPTLDDSP